MVSKLALPDCQDAALHLNPAEKEVVGNTGFLLDWILNQDQMN
jgi:hypothetical protein